MDNNSDFIEYPEKSLLGPDGKLLPEVKDAWITALESGKYHHLKGKLFSYVSSDGTKHMCCLGVLRDVVSPEYSAPSKGQEMYHFSAPRHHFREDHTIYHEGLLANINDAKGTQGYSKQIAYIKENL